MFHLVLESHDGRAPGADSEEKREPVSDIDTVVVDSLKALDPEWPIREADIGRLKTERPVSFHGLLMCIREFAARRAKMDAILRKNHMADAVARAAPKSSNR